MPKAKAVNPRAMTETLFPFEEKRFTTFSHDIRVYIYGQDVSPWLQGEVTINYGGRDSFNTAAFTLANPRQVWQVTTRNQNGLFNQSADAFNEAPKGHILYMKDRFNFNIKLEVKKAALGNESTEKKILADFSASEDWTKGVLPDSLKAPLAQCELKYRLNVNDCVFHRHDPVRIFIKNPLSPSTEQWVEVFCGFVNQHPVTTNYITGESSVRVDCYCIRQMMTKMRAQVNSISGLADPQPIFTSGMFSDFLSQDVWSHKFARQSLEQIVTGLVIGRGLNGQTNTNTRGVGYFKMGNVVCFDPDGPQDALLRWHLLTMFGVNKSALPDASEDLWLTSAEMHAIGTCTVPFRKKPVDGPEGRFLHLLLPAQGTGARDLIEYSVQPYVSEKRSFESRWNVIREFAAKLDFQVLTSPSGDILLEFPQYGFTPHAYRTVPMKCEEIKRGMRTATDGWQALFTFDQHEKEGTLNDEGEDFPTCMTVTGSMAMTEMNASLPDQLAPQAFIYSIPMISRYGVIADALNIPFAGQNWDEIKTQEDKNKGVGGSFLKRLEWLGKIEFGKRIANSSTWSGSVVYRPFLFPNRPVHLKRSGRIGVVTNVTHTWNVGKDATTQIGMNMLMSERKDGSYRLPHGPCNAPIDYAGIWQFNGGASTGTVENNGIHTSSAWIGTPKSLSQQPQQMPLVLNAWNMGGGADMLYPPFKALLDMWFAKCQAAGKPLPPFNPGGGWRSYQGQVNTKKYWMAKAEKFPTGSKQYNELKAMAAEPGKSFHQFGLAYDCGVDNLGVKGGTVPEPNATYGRLAQEVGLTWGGNWKGPYEEWHVQMKIPDVPCSAYYMAELGDPNAQQSPDASLARERAAVHAVWRAIDAKLKGEPPPPLGVPSTSAVSSPSTAGAAQAGVPLKPLKCNPRTMAAPAFNRQDAIKMSLIPKE